MNYLKQYIRLVRKAQKRVLTHTYFEKHHIFPVSIFGKNDKIVKLTFREHFISHRLLSKICEKRYGVKHAYSRKMNMAIHRMVHSDESKHTFSSHHYEIARIACKKSNSGKSRPDMYGKRYFGASDETIKKLTLKQSLARKGKHTNYPKTRKPLSNRTPEVFLKISESRKKTLLKYCNMDNESFWNWVATCEKYTVLKNGKTRPNSNITRAMIAKNIPLKEYYSENDFSKNWFRLNKNKTLFYGKRDSLLS